MQKRHIPHSTIRKQRKRHTVIKKFIIVFILVAFFAYVISWTLSRPNLRISSIELNGNIALQSYEVTEKVKNYLEGKYLYLVPKDSLFFYPRQTIEKSLVDEFKRISDIDLKLRNLSVLEIIIVEREAFAMWCGVNYPKNLQNDRCFFLDREGYIFAEAPQFKGKVYYEFYGPYESWATSSTPLSEVIGAHYKLKNEFERVVAFRNYLDTLGVLSDKIITLPYGDYEMILSDGGKIYWNISRDPLSIISDFEAAYRTELGDPRDVTLRKKLEYIDMRFENKVFFKKI